MDGNLAIDYSLPVMNLNENLDDADVFSLAQEAWCVAWLNVHLALNGKQV